MWKRAILTGAGAVAALAISTGCSGGETGTEHSAGHGTSTSTTVSAAPNRQDHTDADVMFAHHMIPHHQQAIEMSDIVLAKQGIDPRVTDLATQIKAAQGPEIEQMQQWLNEWGNPPMGPMPSGSMPMPSGDMPGHGNMPMPSGDMPGMPGMQGMPGMMSEQDMTALQNAQGVEASKLFLTQMIRHHEGAITMAQNEIKNGQYPAAKEMAQAIVISQQKEIDTMNGILATL
jgi:uncharacterized protein (DUF305 family)